LRIEASHVLGGRRLLERAGVARSIRVTGDDNDIAHDEGAGAVVEAPRQRLILLEVQARPALVAEAGRRFARLGIERIQILAANREDSLVGVAGAAAPVVHAPSRRAVGLLPRPCEPL